MKVKTFNKHGLKVRSENVELTHAFKRSEVVITMISPTSGVKFQMVMNDREVNDFIKNLQYAIL